MLRNVIRLINKRSSTIIDQTALINDRVDEWYSYFVNSSWVQAGVVQPEDMRRFLKLTFMMAILPDRLVRRFDAKLNRNSREINIMDQIKKHRPGCPDLDPSMFACLEQTAEITITPSDTIAQQVHAVTSNQSNPSNTSNPYNPKKNVTCHNCNRKGHVKAYCRTRYCSFHQTNGHGYNQCKTRPRNSTGNNTPNAGNPNF